MLHRAVNNSQSSGSDLQKFAHKDYHIAAKNWN